MEEQGRKDFHQRLNILTSDTTLVAVWKQLQFDITLKDSFQTDSVIKGASNGKFTLPVRKHNDYTFIGWKNKAGVTFTKDNILTSDTTLVAVWKQLQFDITLKDTFKTDSVIKGASNGKFSLPVRSHDDYTFIGWKNKAGNFHKERHPHQRHHADCRLEAAAVRYHVKRLVPD
jgi:hypothetical protein